MSEPSTTTADHVGDLLAVLASTRAERAPFGNDSVDQWSVRASNFTQDFIGRLAAILAQTPEGRDAWSMALAETATYAPSEVAPTISDETLAEVAAVSADYRARGGNDGLIPARPKRGDALQEDWPRGCSIAVGGIYTCTRHVNFTHVACGFDDVKAVADFSAEEIDHARAAAEAQS